MRRTRTGHGGICRERSHFSEAWLEKLAADFERQVERDFEAFQARPSVVPVRISRLRDVGDGIELTLIPADPRNWAWWGEFEDDIEVRRRRRFSRDWQGIRSPEEVTVWLRKRAEAYLAQLQGQPASD